MYEMSMWRSQFLQDRFVACDVYKEARSKFFVELGANDGQTGSNTAALERIFGWRGLCIEPDYENFAILNQSRPLCTNINSVVSGNDEQMLQKGQGSGQSATWAISGTANATNTASKSKSLRTIFMKQRAPQWIDFISLDVEGFELYILKSFPFDEYKVGVFIVEHNFHEIQKSEIRKLMKLNGYTLFRAGTFESCPNDAETVVQLSCFPHCPCVDDWFLHNITMLQLGNNLRNL
ncbi:hypothetical protein CYMTET_13040 [Cymbomonas tetramitiformis]|uniref:Methyltransferase FkbM domain-containing protein n=1 Tax=Cymbomonas tetramitiformis TaxID=36881 RepID=A0AAE0GIW2_9CHLO|nr:hypothetical protein CYMTET_13038 [Cymbomonas tetramitiformis]KAK3279059.1 hypothetical protein CYMTET_13040 [Cymbomonas tetramitiformis]